MSEDSIEISSISLSIKSRYVSEVRFCSGVTSRIRLPPSSNRYRLLISSSSSTLDIRLSLRFSSSRFAKAESPVRSSILSSSPFNSPERSSLKTFTASATVTGFPSIPSCSCNALSRAGSGKERIFPASAPAYPTFRVSVVVSVVPPIPSLKFETGTPVDRSAECPSKCPGVWFAACSIFCPVDCLDGFVFPLPVNINMLTPARTHTATIPQHANILFFISLPV